LYAQMNNKTINKKNKDARIEIPIISSFGSYVQNPYRLWQMTVDFHQLTK
jgi:hypothetical protein